MRTDRVSVCAIPAICVQGGNRLQTLLSLNPSETRYDNLLSEIEQIVDRTKIDEGNVRVILTLRSSNAKVILAGNHRPQRFVITTRNGQMIVIIIISYECIFFSKYSTHELCKIQFFSSLHILRIYLISIDGGKFATDVA